MNKEDIKKLKYNRLLPEERFMISIFDGLEKINLNNYDKIYLYRKNDITYFRYNSITGDFHIFDRTIWFNLEYDYSYYVNNYNDPHKNAKMFIKRMVEKYLKIYNVKYIY